MPAPGVRRTDAGMQVVDDFVGWPRPALRVGGDLEFVERQAARLREVGGGSKCERAAFAAHGSWEAVVDALAAQHQPGQQASR